jgi:hypothetical protein
MRVFRTGSIRGRLLLWSAALTLGALLAAWGVLSSLLSDFVDRRLGAELDAAARAVMAASEWDATAGFAVLPPPADPGSSSRSRDGTGRWPTRNRCWRARLRW